LANAFVSPGVNSRGELVPSPARGQTREINYRPCAPWYNDDLRAVQREKRRLERKFKKSGLTIHKELFTEVCKKYNKMLESYKTSYYRDKINQADRNKLFRLVNGLFQKNSKALPSYTSLELLVEELTTSLSIKFEILEMNWNCTKKTLKYLPKYELDKLQRVQNAAARLITGKKKSDHITPVLKELHWLPIKYRTHFKIILLVYKSLQSLQIIFTKLLKKDVLHVHFDPPDVDCFPLQRYTPRHMESVLFLMLPRNFGTLYQNTLNPLSLF
jgi:hypothetical protein